MHSIPGLLWGSLALLSIACETQAQSCPQEIRGGWHGELAAVV